MLSILKGKIASLQRLIVMLISTRPNTEQIDTAWLITVIRLQSADCLYIHHLHVVVKVTFYLTTVCAVQRGRDFMCYSQLPGYHLPNNLLCIKQDIKFKRLQKLNSIDSQSTSPKPTNKV